MLLLIGIFNTAEIGVAKPDPRVFNHVLSKINHSAQEILFVDDSEENIQVAKSLGFGIHLFKSGEDIKKILG